MNKKLIQLTELTRFYGGNTDFVIAGGGNTSYKDNEHLWVKASGVSMASIDETGFVCMSRNALQKIGSKEYAADPETRERQVKEDLYGAIEDVQGKRPSVETSLHELIDFPFVVHTHPTMVNSIMCSKHALKSTRQLFGDKVLFIEYTDPGYILFRKVRDCIEEYRGKYKECPKTIFLENHGVFVGGNSPEDIHETYNSIVAKITTTIKSALPVGESCSMMQAAQLKDVCNELKSLDTNAQWASNALIQYYAVDRSRFELIAKPFTPDDIVYCKSKYLFVERPFDNIVSQVENFRHNNGYRPNIIVLQGTGIVALNDNVPLAEIALEVFQNMMKVSWLSNNHGGPKFMTTEQIEFIENWEVESYRRKMSKEKH